MQQSQQTPSRKRRRGATASKRIVYGSVSVYLGEQQQQTTKKGTKETAAAAAASAAAGFNAKKSLTHEWTCYVRGVNFEDITGLVKSVTFQLDPSFETIVGYTSKTVTAPQAFAISLRGYGEFVITITLTFQDEIREPPLVLTHCIKLFDSEHPCVRDPAPTSRQGGTATTPLISEFYDEIVIPNPTELACERCAQVGRKATFEGHPLMRHVQERDAMVVYSDEAEYAHLRDSVLRASSALDALYKRYSEVLVEESELKARFIATRDALKALQNESSGNDNNNSNKDSENTEKEPAAKKPALLPDPPSAPIVVDPFLTSEKEITAAAGTSATSAAASSSTACAGGGARGGPIACTPAGVVPATTTATTMTTITAAAATATTTTVAPPVATQQTFCTPLASAPTLPMGASGLLVPNMGVQPEQGGQRVPPTIYYTQQHHQQHQQQQQPQARIITQAQAPPPVAAVPTAMSAPVAPMGPLQKQPQPSYTTTASAITATVRGAYQPTLLSVSLSDKTTRGIQQ